MQSPLARIVLHPADDALVTYQIEDGHSIEPEWYIPILPIILINGAEGIGTGKPLIDCYSLIVEIMVSAQVGVLTSLLITRWTSSLISSA